MCLGIPGEIVSIDVGAQGADAGALSMGQVRFGGATKAVCLAYVPDAVRGRLRRGACGLRHQQDGSRRRGPRLLLPRRDGRFVGAMKFLDEYRDPAAARRYVDAIRATVTRPGR